MFKADFEGIVWMFAGVYQSYLDVQIMESVGFSPCGLPLVKHSDEVILVQLSNLS